jgi:hypothetical protein
MQLRVSVLQSAEDENSPQKTRIIRRRREWSTGKGSHRHRHAVMLDHLPLESESTGPGRSCWCAERKTRDVREGDGGAGRGVAGEAVGPGRGCCFGSLGLTGGDEGASLGTADLGQGRMRVIQ